MSDAKTINDFLSPAGFVCHKKLLKDQNGIEITWWDCGDASQRQFMAIWFWTVLNLKGKGFLRGLFRESLIATFGDDISKADPIRHPPLHQIPVGEELEWWAEKQNYTLDQMRPLICAGIELECTEEILELFKLMKARHGFAWNFRHIGQRPEDKSIKVPDIMGSIEWSLFRAYLSKAKPETLNWYDRVRLKVDAARIWAKAEFRIQWSRLKPNASGDDLNFFIMLRTLSKLGYCKNSFDRYVNNRSVIKTVPEVYQINGIVSCFADYFWNAQEHPPFQVYALALFNQDYEMILNA